MPSMPTLHTGEHLQPLHTLCAKFWQTPVPRCATLCLSCDASRGPRCTHEVQRSDASRKPSARSAAVSLTPGSTCGKGRHGRGGPSAGGPVAGVAVPSCRSTAGVGAPKREHQQRRTRIGGGAPRPHSHSRSLGRGLTAFGLRPPPRRKHAPTRARGCARCPHHASEPAYPPPPRRTAIRYYWQHALPSARRARARVRDWACARATERAVHRFIVGCSTVRINSQLPSRCSLCVQLQFVHQDFQPLRCDAFTQATWRRRKGRSTWRRCWSALRPRRPSSESWEWAMWACRLRPPSTARASRHRLERASGSGRRDSE